MLYHEELQRTRVADLLRAAERARLAKTALAARRVGGAGPRPARRARRGPWVSGWLASRFTRRLNEQSTPGDVGPAAQPTMPTGSRVSVLRSVSDSDGSIPRPRGSVSSHR
jgi:hypothetical protein